MANILVLCFDIFIIQSLIFIFVYGGTWSSFVWISIVNNENNNNKSNRLSSHSSHL